MPAAPSAGSCRFAGGFLAVNTPPSGCRTFWVASCATVPPPAACVRTWCVSKTSDETHQILPQGRLLLAASLALPGRRALGPVPGSYRGSVLPALHRADAALVRTRAAGLVAAGHPVVAAVRVALARSQRLAAAAAAPSPLVARAGVARAALRPANARKPIGRRVPIEGPTLRGDGD